jgi:hypothetical protein
MVVAINLAFGCGCQIFHLLDILETLREHLVTKVRSEVKGLRIYPFVFLNADDSVCSAASACGAPHFFGSLVSN